MEDLSHEEETNEQPAELSMKEKLAQQRELATKLGPYVGQWVAVKGPNIINSAKNPRELIDTTDPGYDRAFKVGDGRSRLLSYGTR